MICKKCGAPLSEGEMICSHCGFTVNSNDIRDADEMDIVLGDKSEAYSNYQSTKDISRTKNKRTTLIIAVISGIIIVGFFITMLVYNLSKIEVPDVKGKTAEEAVEILKKAGFKDKNIKYILNNNEESTLNYQVGDYMIDDQYPESGERMHSSEGITLDVIDLLEEAKIKLKYCEGELLVEAIKTASELKYPIKITNIKGKEIIVKKEDQKKYQILNVDVDRDNKTIKFQVDTIENIKNKEAKEKRKKEEAERKKKEKEENQKKANQKRLKLYDALRATIGEPAPNAVAIAKRKGYKVKIMDNEAIEKIAENPEYKDVLTEDITDSYYDETPGNGYTPDDFRNSLIVEDIAVHNSKNIVTIFVRDNGFWMEKKGY